MNFSTDLANSRLLAIIRGTDAEATYRTMTTLADAGVPLIEISLTGANALEVIAKGRAELGETAWLGAGTVITERDTHRAVEAGANFVVTPGLSAGFHTAVHEGLPTIAGVLTPSEIIAASEADATALKIFPADAMGGPAYLKTLLPPFPKLPFVPVGGVGAREAAQYLEIGATAVGVGSPLIGDAANGGDLAALRTRAAEFVAACS